MFWPLYTEARFPECCDCGVRTGSPLTRRAASTAQLTRLLLRYTGRSKQTPALPPAGSHQFQP